MITLDGCNVQDWSLQCPSNATWPSLKITLQTQPQMENEDVTWSPQYNMPTARTNKRRALSLREVESDGWFLIPHIALETCTEQFMQKFHMSFEFHTIFLDWRLGFELALQLNDWILRALQNETHMKISILNTGWMRGPLVCVDIYSLSLKSHQRIIG